LFGEVLKCFDTATSSICLGMKVGKLARFDR
jgi:hypothetical protein